MRVLFGCVSDNNPKYLSQVPRLVQSIRWFGGRLADSDIRVCFIEEIDPSVGRTLTRLGASLSIVDRFSQRFPYTNKIQFFNGFDCSSYDRVVLLDCDTLVVDDPYEYVIRGGLQAKIADMPTVSHEAFVSLFGRLGLPIPQRKYNCTCNRVETIWYPNSGVLVFSNDVLEPIVSGWRKYGTMITENPAIINCRHKFYDQASLTLSYCTSSVPYNELEANMNYPLHIASRAKGRKKNPYLEQCDPIVLHYHYHVDIEKGLILPCAHFPRVQARIDRYNNCHLEMGVAA